MDDQQNNEQEVGSVPEPARPGPDAPATPQGGEMPLLAASAASRLTQQILSRLSSPFAVPSASPLRPGALWQQVTRRLGVAPVERSRPGPGLPLSPLAPVQTQQARAEHDPFGLEPPQLVWRAAATRNTQKDDVSVEERLARATRPANQTALPFLVPAQTPPTTPQPTPAQVTPPAVSPSPANIATPISQPPVEAGQVPVQTQQTNTAYSAPVSPQQAQSAPHSESTPQVAPPARVVTVEYVQSPAALPIQPLVSHAPLVEEPSYYAPRNLADSLNRDLIPTTDMISRMTRPSWEDMTLPERRQAAPAPLAPNLPAPTTAAAPVVEPEPVPQPVQQAAQPERRVPTVVQPVASPVEEAPRLEMPLVATPTTPAAQAAQREPARTVEEALAQAQRSPVRQLFDRVVNNLPLPETVRRFVTGEPTPTTRPAASTPEDRQQPASAPQPVSTPSAAPLDTQRQVAPAAESAPRMQPPESNVPVQPVTAAQLSTQLEPPTQPAVRPQAPTPIASTSAVEQTASAAQADMPRAATQQMPIAASSQSATPRTPAGSGRTSFDTVPAPAAASAPQSLDMPVRATPSSLTPQAQASQAETPLPKPQPRPTQPEPPAPPLGPFQAFQPAQPPQPQEDARRTQSVEPPQVVPVEPLGPFQPFQPEQNPVVQPAPLSETTVQTSASLPVSVRPAQTETPITPAPVSANEPRPVEAPAPVQSAPQTDTTPVVARTAENTTVITQIAPDGVTPPYVGGEQPAPSGPTPSTPVVREVSPAREAEPRGFLGSLFDRFFGRGDRDAERETGQEQSGTPAIDMPWVRQDRATRTQQDAARTPSEFELPATRMAEPVAPSSTPAQTPVAPVAVMPAPLTPQVTPVAANQLQVETQSQPQTQPQASTPTSFSQTTPIPAPVTAESATSPITSVQPTSEATPFASESPVTSSSAQEYSPSQVDTFGDVSSDTPDLPRVLPVATPASTPAPLDMPHASTGQQFSASTYEETEDTLQRALLPTQAVAVPSVPISPPVADLPPAEAAPIAVAEAAVEPVFVAAETAQAASPQAEQSEALPVPVVPEAPQAWTVMPDMADGVVRSHAPISAVEPMETAAQGDLLARILGSLGHSVALSNSGLTELPRAVPAPQTGVGTDLPFTFPSNPEPATSTTSEPVYSSGAPMATAPAQHYAPASTPIAGTPTPIGTPATPLMGRPQFIPDGLRDIRTTSNLPAINDSFARPVTPTAEMPGPAATPDPVSMPPRYITNVTPATYLAESAIAGAQSGGSPLGTVIHPASYMSPSMGDYGWPGDSSSPVTPSVMLPLSEMSPTADSFAQSDAAISEQPQSTSSQSSLQSQYEQSSEQGQQAPWMEALQALYGQKSDDTNMPLAIPYGAFALPSESSTSPTTTWQSSGYGQSGVESSQGRPASQGFSSLPMPTPSAPTFQSDGDSQLFSPSQSSSSNSSWSSGSWSTDGMTDSGGYSSWSADNSGDGDSGEAGAWADVVASAVSGASEGAPALALAAEERGSSAPQAPAEPSNTQDGGKGASADLDELAESVLDIIRNRIVIERERNFG